MAGDRREPSAIGRRLGRVASTMSRELRGNALPTGGDRPVYAEGCYRARRQRLAVLERDERLRRFVHQRLLETWTPEQIAGWLKRGEERQLRTLCLETIYAFIHRPAQKAASSGGCCPAGAPGVAAGQRAGRAPASPIGSRFTTARLRSTTAARPDIGRVIS